MKIGSVFCYRYQHTRISGCELLYALISFVALLLQFPVASVAAPLPIPDSPILDARSYLLEDHNSGKVLAEHNADEHIEPASITKLMTAYIVYEALADGRITLDDQVYVSEKAWRMSGSRMFIEVGSKVRVDELLDGLVIQSGNDSAVALAELISGTEEEFVKLMNLIARELGLTNTHYSNATGLPNKEHYTSARDIAKLTRVLIREFPEEYKRYAEPKYTYNGITQYNRNSLINDSFVDGVKTGHTDSAGYCLVASAKQKDMRLISVVIGSKTEKSRTVHSRTLLAYGFRYFESHKLYSAREPLTEARVWKGYIKNVQLGLENDFFVTIPKGQYKYLKASMEVQAQTQAPVLEGQNFGDVSIFFNEEVVSARPLVALQSVDKGGMIRWTVDFILQLFN